MKSSEQSATFAANFFPIKPLIPFWLIPNKKRLRKLIEKLYLLREVMPTVGSIMTLRSRPLIKKIWPSFIQTNQIFSRITKSKVLTFNMTFLYDVYCKVPRL